MTTTIQDNSNILSPGDIATLQSQAYPFDVSILIQSSGRDELEDAAHNAVNGPHVVVIAWDPQHHHVVARFGTETGVKTGDFDSIAKAGNAHFRANQYVSGLEAIAVRAQASSQARTAMAVSSEPVIIEQGMSGSTWAGLALLLAAVVSAIVWQVRRNRRQQAQFDAAAAAVTEEAATYRGKNMDAAEQRDWDTRLYGTAVPNASLVGARSVGARAQSVRIDPGYTTSVPLYVPQAVYPAPVYVDDGNSLLTGMLIGEALSQPQVVVEREVVVERSSSDYSGSSSSYDNSSSSYDSSSSSDSGGSLSSYDSGSSSYDSGGGGFDSGGGGSDY